MQASDQAPDYSAIKAKQQQVWGSGDYSQVGSTLQITGEELCESMDLHSGQSVLDVAAGNGNATMAAARRFCEVTSTDYVEALLNESKQRAQANHLAVNYQQADAEALPFEDESFDNVMSTFGVMFTPNQQQSASEMLRVCKKGGKIGMANWTPDGFIGQLFKVIGKYNPPPQGVNSPANWGTQDFLQREFGEQASNIQVNEKNYSFRYKSPQHWMEVFRNYYGPTLKTFEMLDAPKAEALEADIYALLDQFNTATDGTLIVPSKYFEVVIEK